ncbi:MAG TPA: RES family NAD+ phosphorylase [Chitinophagaceae bacterium]|nr:RES family NAD+ phosphorylase [Chitinophagaceae bacterium]
MTVYRITTAKWAGKLAGSGRAARWNSNGLFMIYTAGTRALACLENLAHRKAIGPNETFKITLINIPDNIRIEKIVPHKLPGDWKEYIKYNICQAIGDEWIHQLSSAVLRVPSAIIPEEYNYLINPAHPDFSKISISELENFIFDERL